MLFAGTERHQIGIWETMDNIAWDKGYSMKVIVKQTIRVCNISTDCSAQVYKHAVICIRNDNIGTCIGHMCICSELNEYNLTELNESRFNCTFYLCSTLKFFVILVITIFLYSWIHFVTHVLHTRTHGRNQQWFVMAKTMPQKCNYCLFATVSNKS